jgi:hypothetical protein
MYCFTTNQNPAINLICQKNSELNTFMEVLPSQVLEDDKTYCTGVEIDANKNIQYKLTQNSIQSLQLKLQDLSESLEEYCFENNHDNHIEKEIQIMCMDILQFMLPL